MLTCTYTIFLYPVNISEMDVRTSNLDADITVGINSLCIYTSCTMFTPRCVKSSGVDVLYVVMNIEFLLLCAASVS